MTDELKQLFNRYSESVSKRKHGLSSLEENALWHEFVKECEREHVKPHVACALLLRDKKK